MGKFNRALGFSAPLIIYALGLWGSRQALIGTIVYMVWIFMGLDEAEYKTKKPVGRDWPVDKSINKLVRNYQLEKANLANTKQKIISAVLEGLVNQTEAMTVKEAREYINETFNQYCGIEEIRADVTKNFEEYISHRKLFS